MPDYLSNDYKWWGQVFKVANKVSRQRRNENTFRRKVAANKIQRAYIRHDNKRWLASKKIQAMIRGKQARNQYKVLQHVRDVDKGYRAALLEKRFPHKRVKPWRQTAFWNREYPKYQRPRLTYAQAMSQKVNRRANGSSFYKNI
jgi:hypothetical protein